MGKLPEDLQLALEGLGLLNEKFIKPLSRLDQVLRVCAESHVQIAEANKRLEKVKNEIAEAQQKALQQEERSQTRMKAMTEQFSTIQAKWSQQVREQEEKSAGAQHRLEQLEASCGAKARQLEELEQTFQEETKLLKELRERIRRAQTMEP